MGRIRFLFLLLATLLGTRAASAQVNWAIQSVDVGSARAGSTSLGLIQGYPVISYFGTPRNLKYASLNPTTRLWNLLPVDAGGEYNSLAVDAAGIIHVAYLDANAGQLRYWRNNLGQGSIQLIDSETGLGGMGYFNSIKVDGSGQPRASYYYLRAPDGSTNADRLKFAAQSGSSWARTFADPAFGRGRYNSLGLDASGNPQISYYDDGAVPAKLRLARALAGIWTTQVVDSVGNPGWFNSIAVDPTSGLPRISYIAAVPQELRFAYHNGAAWFVEDVAGVGTFGSSAVTSLALDAGGTPHIAYYDAATTSLRYASRAVGGIWTSEVVDSAGDVGGYCSLRFDSSNRPVISYYDATTQSIKIAYGDYPDNDVPMGDGIPDVFDPCPSNPDCNNNGIVDGREGGTTQGGGFTVSHLPDESIFGCGSLAMLYRAGPPRGGPPPWDLLFLLAPAAYLLRKKAFLSRRGIAPAR